MANKEEMKKKGNTFNCEEGSRIETIDFNNM